MHIHLLHIRHLCRKAFKKTKKVARLLLPPFVQPSFPYVNFNNGNIRIKGGLE